MRVLVSNDDGVEAPGIHVLARRLAVVGEVVIVAPDRDRSGASNSLTLDQPIRVTRLEENRYRVAGTPTDCVHLALCRLARQGTRYRRFRHQQFGQSRRRRDLFGHGFGGDGRALSRPARDRRVAGHARITPASITKAPRRRRWRSCSACSSIRCRPTRSSTSMCRIVPGTSCAASRSRGWASAIVPRRASRRSIRAAVRSGGSGRPARSTTTVRARISTRCARATSRSRRSMSI